MVFILIIFAFLFLSMLLGKISEHRDKIKKRERDYDLTMQANRAVSHPDMYIEQGKVKNGWSRVKLAEHRYAYVKLNGNRVQHMSPDKTDYPYLSYPSNPNDNIFEQAEEFNYTSAIVTRGSQDALLGTNANYLIPFERINFYDRTVSSSLRDLGDGILEYKKTVRNKNDSHILESIHSIIDRDARVLYEGSFNEVHVENGRLIVENNQWPYEKEKAILELPSGKILFPFHALSKILYNGKILFYSRSSGPSGWNVYDSNKQTCVFNNMHSGIVYLEEKNRYVLSDKTLCIADESGNVLHEISDMFYTIYDEQYFYNSHCIMDIDGNMIAKVADGTLSFIYSGNGKESSLINFSGTYGSLSTELKFPFSKQRHDKVFFIQLYDNENHAYSVLNLRGGTVIGPLINKIEPIYSFDNKNITGLKSLSEKRNEWQIYDLYGNHIKNEPNNNHSVDIYDYFEYLDCMYPNRNLDDVI